MTTLQRSYYLDQAVPASSLTQEALFEIKADLGQGHVYYIDS